MDSFIVRMGRDDTYPDKERDWPYKEVLEAPVRS